MNTSRSPQSPPEWSLPQARHSKQEHTNLYERASCFPGTVLCRQITFKNKVSGDVIVTPDVPQLPNRARSESSVQQSPGVPDG